MNLRSILVPFCTLLIFLVFATRTHAMTTADGPSAHAPAALWTHPLPAPLSEPLSPAPHSPYTLSGAGWTFRHDPKRFGVFVFQSGDQTVEQVACEPLVLLGPADRIATLSTTQAEMNVHTPTRLHNRLETTVHLVDANGRTWTIRRTFRPENEARELLICTDILYDPHRDAPADARILHVPYLTLLVNRTSSGHKHQALLAGVEYLGDERSSSTCDMPTPASDRRIPADFRLTAPLAIFTTKTSALAAQWFLADPSVPERFATIFDTPDRVYHSGGHLLAFWAPAVGPARAESSFAITTPTPFRRGRQTVRLRATPGSFVTDALDAVLAAADLPAPMPLPSTNTLTRLAHEGRAILRHAPSRLPFASPLFTTNLLVRTNQAFLSSKPAHGKQSTSPMTPRDPLDLTSPGTATICGILARQIKDALVAATWSGDEAFIAHALSAVDRLTTLTRGNVPRGGHPDELPLHTPDLQAATDLATCYTSAYLLRPRESTLREARRWCTSGLAFLRLTPPEMGTDPATKSLKPLKTVIDPAKSFVWTYTTTAALGATPGTDPGKIVGTDPGEKGTDPGKIAGTDPSWIGYPRPLEALAYAQQLVELARLEPTRRRTRYWRMLARGITHSASWQLYPASDPIDGGLLPTAWDLRTQRPLGRARDAFPLQQLAAEFCDCPFDSCRAIPFNATRPSLLHVPGRLSPARKIKTNGDTMKFQCEIMCWPDTPCSAILTRIDRPLPVALNGQSLTVQYRGEERLLIISLPQRAKGVLQLNSIP